MRRAFVGACVVAMLGCGGERIATGVLAAAPFVPTLSDARLEGWILPGHESVRIDTGSPARFYALRFRGHPGDTLQVWAHAEGREPVLWVLDAASRPIAASTTANGGTAYLIFTLPGAPPEALRDHFVVLAERRGHAAAIEVTLHRGPCAPPGGRVLPDADGPSICTGGFHWDGLVCNCVTTERCDGASPRPCDRGRICVAAPRYRCDPARDALCPGVCAFRPPG
jgi:hypothetical protein